MSNPYDQAKNVMEATPWALAGVVQIAKWIKFKRCDIYIENNHPHNIFVALNDCKKENIRGWFSVNPYKRTNIYETDRQTSQVGIYAECRVCGRIWEASNSIYSQYIIPGDGREFKIEYVQVDSNGCFAIDPKWDAPIKLVSFIFSDYISQKGEYTFQLN